MPTAAILNQERERWARKQVKSLSVSAAVLSGSLIKQTNVPLAAVSSAFSGSLMKKVLAVLSATASAFSGSLVKKTLHALSAIASAFNGSLVKKILVVLSALASAFNGSLVKKTLHTLSAIAAALNGNLIKKTLVVLSAVASAFNGSLIKKTLVVLSAIGAAFNGALAHARLKVLALSATMVALSGGIVKKTLIPLSALASALFGAQTKLTSHGIVASAMAFSGSLNKFTQKFLNAVSSAWNAILQAIKTTPVVPPAPAVFKPIHIGQVIARFGINSSNPPEVDEFSSATQFFSRTAAPFPSFLATPDNWGSLGQRAMGGELLIAPGSGSLSGNIYYAVMGGDITIPASASNVGLSITLFENYFTQAGPSISTQSDPLVISPVSVTPGSTILWSVVCRLSGNSPRNGILKAEQIINGQPGGVMYSNFNPSVEPKIQLSLGVNLQGSGSDSPQIRLLQFELQQK